MEAFKQGAVPHSILFFFFFPRRVLSEPWFQKWAVLYVETLPHLIHSGIIKRGRASLGNTCGNKEGTNTILWLTDWLDGIFLSPQSLLLVALNDKLGVPFLRLLLFSKTCCGNTKNSFSVSDSEFESWNFILKCHVGVYTRVTPTRPPPDRQETE